MTTPMTLHSPVSGDFSWTVSETVPNRPGPDQQGPSSETNYSWEFGLSSESLGGDIAIPPVLAVAAGEVKSVELLDGMQVSSLPSVVVTIEHQADGRIFHSNYLFQADGSIEVRVGDAVEAGDVIAWMDAAGASGGSRLRVVVGDALDPASLSNDDLLLGAEHVFTAGFLGDGSGLPAGMKNDLPPQSQAGHAGPHAGNTEHVANSVSGNFDIPDIDGENELSLGGVELVSDSVSALAVTELVVADVEDLELAVEWGGTTDTEVTTSPTSTDMTISTSIESPEPVTSSVSSTSSSGLLDDAGNNSLIESLVKKFLDGEVGADALQSFVVDGANQTGVIRVSTNQELINALKSASGGETILLESGNYGTLNLYDGSGVSVQFASEVKIKSADFRNPAIFENVSLNGVKNLTFDSVKFDYDALYNSPEWISPFKIVSNSSNINIYNSVFVGDFFSGSDPILNGTGTGNGIFVSDSVNISLSSNEFYNWNRAGVFDNVDNLLVSNNNVHHIRSDGFNFVEVNNVVVESNHIHDFIAAPMTSDHRDMIQFWTTGTTNPSTEIIIRGNVLTSGTGDYTQSIFMRNEVVDLGQSGAEMYYRNVTIEDNIIHNANSHGITVGETDGLLIQNNTLLHNRASGNDGSISVPMIDVKAASVNVSVINNVVPTARAIDNAGWNIGNNLVVQLDDPGGENYVGDLFVNAVAAADTTPADLTAVNGGLVELLGVGSNLTRFDDTPDTTIGYVENVAGVDRDLLTHSFDASNVYGPNGKIDLSGSQIEWNFGDGNFGGGVSAIHKYEQAGTYDVEALVTLATGGQVVLRKSIEVQTPVALKTDFDNGPADTSDLVNAVTVGSAVTFEQAVDGDAVRLNNGVIGYERSHELRGNSEFSILFDFKKDLGNETDSGTVIYYTGSFIVSVQSDGLNVRLFTDQGSESLTVSNLGINDAQWHRVAFTFSGRDGEAILYVDGSEAGRLSGLTDAIQTGSEYHDFHVGDPFGKSFSGLIDNVGFLRGAIDAADSNAGFSKLDSQTAQDTSGPTSSSVDQLLVTNSLPIVGSEGDDTLNGTIWKDDIQGNGGNDILSGRDGDDFLSGGDGNDLLIGGDGNDVLIGGKGNDVLAGLKGADSVQGGAGADVFVLTDTATADQLTDYIEVDGDVVDLTLLFEINASGGTRTDNINDFVRLELDSDAGKTNLQVDQDGGLGNDAFATVAVVNTTEAIRVNYDDDGTDASALLWL